MSDEERAREIVNKAAPPLDAPMYHPSTEEIALRTAYGRKRTALMKEFAAALADARREERERCDLEAEERGARKAAKIIFEMLDSGFSLDNVRAAVGWWARYSETDRTSPGPDMPAGHDGANPCEDRP